MDRILYALIHVWAGRIETSGIAHKQNIRPKHFRNEVLFHALMRRAKE